jgi:tellurite resistance protein TerC
VSLTVIGVTMVVTTVASLVKSRIDARKSEQTPSEQV